MSEITIIMPTLNVVKYISSCLESVINQTFEDLEILIIDAGSTDGTLEILQEYEKNDTRIKLLSSKRKSYGYQLNMGIQLAKGQFVGVVETDDYIEKDMFEVLYRAITTGDYDYVKGAAQTFREVGKDILVSTDIKCTPYGRIELNPSEHPELFVTDRFLWLGLYKTELIKKIRLNETPGAAYQDIGFIYQVLHRASKALYLDQTVYHYRQDNQNASGYNTKAFKYLYDEYIGLVHRKNSYEWLQAIYIKMAQQSLGRFHNMALSGQLWTEYEAETEAIRKWLVQAQKDGYLNEQNLGKDNWQLLLAWKDDVWGIYKICKNKYDEEIKRLWKCFSEVGQQKIVIFGAGRWGKFFHALCENKYMGKVIAYCDNKQELWTSSIQGRRVYSPVDAVQLFPDTVFVITISKEKEIVKEQLLAIGLNEKNIVEFRPDIDYLLLNAKY